MVSCREFRLLASVCIGLLAFCMQFYVGAFAVDVGVVTCCPSVQDVTLNRLCYFRKLTTVHLQYGRVVNCASKEGNRNR